MAFGTKLKSTVLPVENQTIKAFNLEKPHIYHGDDWEDYQIKTKR